MTKKVVPRPQVVRKHHLWPFATTGEASAPVSSLADFMVGVLGVGSTPTIP